jgi:glucose/arabinose dehydrogenase
MHRLGTSSRLRALATVLATLAATVPVVLATASRADAIPAGLADQAVISGLNLPMDVEFSPDGRIYVAEKRGVIQEFDSLNDPTPTTVVDLRTEVNSNHDRGLMSFALSPNFPTDPSVWVLYAYDANASCAVPCWGQPNQDDDPCPNPPGGTADGCVISGRLSKLNLSQPDGGTEQVLVQDWCQQFDSHSLGHLEFGPDGFLYASAGDGASYNFADYGQEGSPVNPCGDPPAGVGGTQTPPTAEGGALRSQDYQTTGDPQGLDGSIIRIDPDTGQGAPGNPLAGRSDPNARRIIASGLRNPFRFTFRPDSNELWIGDVGYNDWEELNRLTNPTDGTVHNFGWPCREGNTTNGYQSVGLNLCQNIFNGSVPTEAPFYTYQHGQPVAQGDGCDDANGSSISGDAFYEGASYPTAYHGALFFADYSRRCLWTMRPDVNGVPDPTTRQVFETNIFPVDIEKGPNSDLFYVDIGLGEIHRIFATGGNTPPTAAVSATPDHGDLPLDVALSAAGSSDIEPGALTYAWDLDGDGQYDDAIGGTTNKTYSAAGEYFPAVRVTDSGGQSSTAKARVLAGTTPPIPTIDTPAENLSWKVGDQIAFSGSAIDGEDGALPASALKWTVVLHHCPTDGHCHEHPLTSFNGVASGSFDAIDHEYPMYLELRLTATDSTGVKTTVSRPLYPKVHSFTVKTDPAGLKATVGDKTDAGPFTVTVVAGSNQGVSTPATQTLGSSTFTFTGWSDGRARVHNLTAPDSDFSLTANFSRAIADDPSLVAAYSFDERSGTSLLDRSGNANTGAVEGEATWSTAGHSGGALWFDGVNDRVTIADAPELDLTNGMTLEAWVKPALADQWRAVIAKEKAGGSSYALYASDPADSPVINVFKGVQDVRAGGSPLALNRWSHLAATYDGTELRLFVNGLLVGTQPMTGPMDASALPLYLGGHETFGGEWFKGLIDDIRIYNRALGDNEITADMQFSASDDATPPTVSLTAPASGLKLSGPVSVKATASDASGIAGVQFRLDGNKLGAEDTTAPYTVSWASKTAANGKHVLTAVARDAAGNTKTSSSVTVTVANQKPGKVRALKVEGAKAAKRRLVDWTAPRHNGGFPVTSYRVVVRKGTKLVLTKTVKASQLTLKRAKLPQGKLTVTVRATNKIGSGPGARTTFVVKQV